ncbi:ketopantoate reductase family protein [Streptomyces sp. NPDC052040]|uniref:ketopantoate reductase family protein n=1 Tax=unclassified Streptomyces TaxID=2593676 RepID=UPI0037CE97D0
MNDARPGTVAILGPGGVGGLLAALLSRAGHEVICLAGESTVQVLNSRGISVRSRHFGDFTASVTATTHLSEPVDMCLIACKQTALNAALERVPADVLTDGLTVPLLNGVEHPALLRQRYRPEQVVPGVIRVETTRTAPGVITHSSPFVQIDLASTTAPAERIRAAAAMLEGAGVQTRVSPDETTALWTKMSFLAPMALLTTRYGITIGDLRTRYRDELLTLTGEATAVARACGAAADADAVMNMYDTFPAETKSSMQRDAEAGRALELDAIGGALLRAADRHGMTTPLAARLVAELERTASAGQ